MFSHDACNKKHRFNYKTHYFTCKIAVTMCYKTVYRHLIYASDTLKVLTKTNQQAQSKKTNQKQ